jgi:hypothetical protein
VGVFAGVKVGKNVGGSVTLNPTIAVEASRLELPEKLAISDVISGTLGVSLQDLIATQGPSNQQQGVWVSPWSDGTPAAAVRPTKSFCSNQRLMLGRF